MAEISASKARTIMRKTMAKGEELDLKPLSVIVLELWDCARQGLRCRDAWDDR